MLTREQLLQATKRRFKILDVPHLGPVKIRSLTERERARFEADNLAVMDTEDTETEGLQLAKRRLIVLCVCDGDGNPILTPADVEALGDMDGAITGFLFDECKRFVGLGADGKVLADILGNSKATPPDGSRSS